MHINLITNPDGDTVTIYADEYNRLKRQDREKRAVYEALRMAGHTPVASTHPLARFACVEQIEKMAETIKVQQNTVDLQDAKNKQLHATIEMLYAELPKGDATIAALNAVIADRDFELRAQNEEINNTLARNQQLAQARFDLGLDFARENAKVHCLIARDEEQSKHIAILEKKALDWEAKAKLLEREVAEFNRILAPRGNFAWYMGWPEK
jgi:septal ring factor EnvC (AmiA/AmiB activator)